MHLSGFLATILPFAVQEETQGSAWIRELLPPWMFTVQFLNMAPWQWIGLGIAAACAWLAGWALQALASRLVAPAASRTTTRWNDQIVRLFPGPVRLFASLAIFHVALPLLSPPAGVQETLGLIIRLGFIVTVVWFAIRFVSLGALFAEEMLIRKVTDEGRIRAIRTQISVPKRILHVAIWLVGGSMALMQFEVVRNIGISLIASASVAGILIGLSAQRVIGNLLAGMQLAITQPIRIGDVVIVENEWGWIEEITLTYVVVKVWDLRRLVLPVTYFLERPFQNWTKASPDILGTVFLYTDYTIPVEEIRAKLDEVLARTDLWDKKVKGVQVTDIKEGIVECRILVSATDSSKAWDLRCYVREEMLKWLQTRARDHLPRHRLEIHQAS